MTAFAAALDALFADAHLARDVVYTAEGGAPSLVRAILRRPDDVTGFGEARIWSETTRLDLRLSEVANPRPGDRIEIDGEACGSIGVRHAAAGERAHSAELGYWLGVDYWGQGFGTEAARAVIDYYFEEFDLDQLIAGARVVNPSSRNILEKCGFQWSGVELHRFEALGSSSPVEIGRAHV